MTLFATRLAPEAALSIGEKQVLRNRLNTFYGRVTDYFDFAKVNRKPLYWEPVAEAIREAATHSRPVRVLEVGAGCSGFADFLRERNLRKQVDYTAQDVTDQNANWLRTQADHLVLADVGTLTTQPASFDVIFSTFVLEHVTDPAQHLQTLVDLLKPGGKLFIFCPRYDVPGYFCPSSRHLSVGKRAGFFIDWFRARANAVVRRRPAFLIQTDLAAFHQPFFIDADAVHWVSMLDLRLWAQQRQLRFRPVRLVTLGNTGLKNWLVKRWLTCAAEVQKN